MTHEFASQIDFWGQRHPPRPYFDESSIERFIYLTHPERGIELGQTGFVEFEQFVENSGALIGIDYYPDEPNIKIIYAVNPWRQPSSEIYYLEGNLEQPLLIYRYRSKAQKRRRMSDIEKIFFAQMYPKKERTHLERLSPKQVHMFIKQHPIFSLLKCTFSLEDPVD